MDSPTVWAQHDSYPPRKGNEIRILIDGQAAYREVADAFHRAKKFIYLTISYGDEDFLLVPERGEKFFDILRSRREVGVDIRMVVWQPALKTPDTIPDPSPDGIAGVNEGNGSIQARWDRAKGYGGWYQSPHGHFVPFYLNFPPQLGCHHQKVYIMDDGDDGVLAFIGGINPVQAYWDTPAHDSLDVRRLAPGPDLLKGLEKTPPLHDIFYRIKGPAVADVHANFVERYNGASIPCREVTSDVVSTVNAEQIPPVADGVEVQVVRTIAPGAYPAIPDGDRGIRELYLNMLGAAGQGSLIYIENQYFFDHGIISEIHEAAERGAKIIVILTSEPDKGTLVGEAESVLEEIAHYQVEHQSVTSHRNVALLTLGNSRADPRSSGTIINSETYVHSKNMAVFGGDWARMTGGSANIAFTSMWFHSEMNIAFADIALITNYVAWLWSEHLQVSVEKAMELIEKPEDALTFFKSQAILNRDAWEKGQVPQGRVYEWGTEFPRRDLDGIDLASLP